MSIWRQIIFWYENIEKCIKESSTEIGRDHETIREITNVVRKGNTSICIENLKQHCWSKPKHRWQPRKHVQCTATSCMCNVKQLPTSAMYSNFLQVQCTATSYMCSNFLHCSLLQSDLGGSEDILESGISCNFHIFKSSNYSKRLIARGS